MKKSTLANELILAIFSQMVISTGGFWAIRMLSDEHSKLIAMASTIILLLMAAGFHVNLHYLRKQVRLAKNHQGISEMVHSLVHHTRDEIIRAGAVVPTYRVPAAQAGETLPRPHPALVRHLPQINQMLADVVELFELVVPSGVNVMAALRDYRADGGYHTILRAGKYNPARALTSKPLYKGQGTILNCLRESYSQKSCVIVTGSNKGAEWWEKHPNDRYGADLSVMMGVVMVRSWDETGFVANKHAWILSVSVNQEDVFSETDVPLMKACTDLFSAVANAVVREDEGGAMPRKAA